MKITVTTTAQKLKEIMTEENYSKLVKDVVRPYNLTIQNLGGTAIYLERTGDATVENGYKLSSLNEVEMAIHNPDSLSLIAETSNNANIRVITT